jgi:hypothetical protein
MIKGALLETMRLFQLVATTTIFATLILLEEPT